MENKYTVKKKNKNPNDILIHKIGYEPIDASFTIGQVLAQIAQFEKLVIQNKGQADIHDAEMENVVANHPNIKKITEKTKQACFVYVNSLIAKEKCEAEVKAYQESIDNQLKEIDIIRKELKLPTVVKIKDLNVK